MRVALEAITWQHDLHAEVEAKKSDQRAEDGGDDDSMSWLLLIGDLGWHDITSKLRCHAIHMISMATAVMVVLIFILVQDRVFEPSYNGPIWV